MKEIVNSFLSAGDTFMSEMHLRQFGYTYNACGDRRWKQYIQIICIKVNQIKLVSKTIWLMEILSDYLEGQLLMKYYEMQHLIFSKNPKFDGYQGGIDGYQDGLSRWLPKFFWWCF